MRGRRSVKFLLRVVISLGLLALIYTSLDFSALASTLRQMTIGTFFITAALYCIGQLMSAAKWHIFLNGISLNRSKLDVIMAYFLGMFVNTFGLGTVGGDIARGLALRPEKGGRAAALATVLADRLHGIAILASICAFSALLFPPPFAISISRPLSVIFFLGVFAFLFLGPQLADRVFSKSQKYSAMLPFLKRIFGGNWGALIRASILSFFFHCLQIVMHWIISQQLGLNLSLPFLFVTVPIVNIASTLPLSISGLGVREGLWLFFFSYLGLSKESAIAFGAFWFVCVTLVSALAGLVCAPNLKIGTIERLAEDVEYTDELDDLTLTK